jgi:hypothetical protein
MGDSAKDYIGEPPYKIGVMSFEDSFNDLAGAPLYLAWECGGAVAWR